MTISREEISDKTKARIVAINIIQLLTQLGMGWDINRIALDQVRGMKDEDEDGINKTKRVANKEDPQV